MAPSGGSGGTPPTRRSPRKKAAPAAPVAGNIMHLLRRVDPPSAPANVSDLGDVESMPPPAPRPRAEPGALGSARDPSLELWATKHVPTSEATLVVAKKKLDVLREWLAGWDAPRRDPKSPRVLLVVGPPGSGKSAAIRFVANEFGRDVHEWRAPVPTLWEEHRHAHGGADGRTKNAPGSAPAYASKLDDFAAFVQRASRYAPLACVSAAAAGARPGDKTRHETTHVRQQHDTHKHKQPVLLVEDLPIGGGEDQQRRALDLLARLAREARVPAAVAVSEEDAGGVGGLGSNPAGGGGGGGGGGAGDVRTKNRTAFGPHLAARSIVAAMEAAGAKVVVFNPATAPKLVKALAAVAAAERVDVDDAGLAAIAAAAEGDVRCALASLQMFAAGRSGRANTNRGNKGKPRSGKRAAPAPARRKKSAAGDDGDEMESDIFGGETHDEDAKRARRDATAADGARRDRGLSVFHALGKILHNKRDEDEHALSVPSKSSRQSLQTERSSARGDAASRDEEKEGGAAGASEAPKKTHDEIVHDARSSASFPSGSDKKTVSREPFTSGKPARVTNDDDENGSALWFGSAVPPFPLHARWRRGKTKYGEPEAILNRARFGAERATTFLFENFAEGLRDDAVEDAALGAAYLSDAAWFASAGRSLAIAGFGFSSSERNGDASFLTDGNGAPADPGAVGELVAGSVATRGLLFAPHPSRPSLRGFRAFKGPQSARAHRAAVANLQEVRAVVAAASGGDFSVGSDRTAAAAETLPMLRVIAGAGPEGAARVPYLPTRWVRVGEDPATAGGVAGLPPGARCAPRPGQAAGGLESGVDRARAGDEDEEEEEEDIEDADDF